LNNFTINLRSDLRSIENIRRVYLSFITRYNHKISVPILTFILNIWFMLTNLMIITGYEREVNSADIFYTINLRSDLRSIENIRRVYLSFITRYNHKISEHKPILNIWFMLTNLMIITGYEREVNSADIFY
jgi:hypothetical protein